MSEKVYNWEEEAPGQNGLYWHTFPDDERETIRVTGDSVLGFDWGPVLITDMTGTWEYIEADSIPTPGPRKHTWPKKTSIYLHSDKDSNWETGQELGLSDEAISEQFKYAVSELEVHLDVFENGEYDVVAITMGGLTSEVHWRQC